MPASSAARAASAISDRPPSTRTGVVIFLEAAIDRTWKPGDLEPVN
jgi:hypothetical protein